MGLFNKKLSSGYYEIKPDANKRPVLYRARRKFSFWNIICRIFLSLFKICCVIVLILLLMDIVDLPQFRNLLEQGKFFLDNYFRL